MTTSDISVRKAGPGDAADIANLGARTFLTAFGADNKPEGIDAYVAESFNRDTIEGEIKDSKSAFLLVVRDNTNIGYAKLRRGKVPDCVDGPKPIEIERIYVDASHQGIGVGATLMRAIVDHARSEGCATVWLGVWEKNAAARKFYERQGFTLVGTKFFMLGDDLQNDIVMRRILD